MENSRDTHFVFHFVMDKPVHEANFRNGVYPAPLDSEIDPALTIKQQDSVSFEDLQHILTEVGGPYGWDRRKEYHDPESVKKIDAELKEPTSKYFTFFANNKPVGGTIIANIESLELLFDGVSRLNPASKLKAEDAENATEIFKIGLYPKYTNRGWGRHFLPMVLSKIFETSSIVYLNTRSTNHDGVPRFYKDQGMKLIHAQSQENDLIPEAAQTVRRSGLILPSHGLVQTCATP